MRIISLSLPVVALVLGGCTSDVESNEPATDDKAQTSEAADQDVKDPQDTKTVHAEPGKIAPQGIGSVSQARPEH